MAKRKALSAEEKRCKLMEIFQESSDVFQLKELERFAPKEKGIVLQSVKGTLQELVDGGQVHSEKISGSIYFWAFLSEALNTTKRLLAENEALNAQLQGKIDSSQEQLKTATASLKHAGEAAEVSSEIELLRKEKETLEERASRTANDIDYDKISAKEKDTKKIIEATNRWTDNIFLMKSWCKRKFDKDDREMDKAFGIPGDLDYLDI